MSVDVAKLAERLAQLNKKGGGGSKTGFHNINDGKNVFRILPPIKGAEDFAQEVFVHYKVGKSDTSKGVLVVCPTTHGDDKKCPVCELAKQFWAMSSKKDDKYDKMAKEVARKKRVYMNAIDRADDLDSYQKDDEGKWTNVDGEDPNAEESPVKVLAVGVGVYKDILGFIVDPEYGDITDVENGLDVKITKSGSAMLTNYDVKTVRNNSPLGFDEWEECCTDLTTLAVVKTYDEIAAIMSGEESTDGGDSEEDAPPPKANKGKNKPVVDDDDDDEDAPPPKANKNKNKPVVEDNDDDDDDAEAEIQAAIQRRKNKGK